MVAYAAAGSGHLPTQQPIKAAVNFPAGLCFCSLQASAFVGCRLVLLLGAG